MAATATHEVRVVGRYALYGAIAAGGMATVHLGRLLGPVGFSRTVAIKRLHAHFASDPEFVSGFLDEARLAARIRHPNVVPTLDVVATDGELFLVMEYVPGESLSRLVRTARERGRPVPLRILSSIMAGVLHGLHAAHEAHDERGLPLGIVHRDVSPQNVLVGVDGVTRVLDFGVAKAAGRMQTTKAGQMKGKLAYMPPEQLLGSGVSRQTDIYATGVMLWEAITGERLFGGEHEGAVMAKILEGKVRRPSSIVAAPEGATLHGMTFRQLESLDDVVLRALRMTPAERFPTARDMALHIERTVPPATASEVGDWVEAVARDILHTRAALIAEIESSSPGMSPDGGALPPGALVPMPALAVPMTKAPSVSALGAARPDRQSTVTALVVLGCVLLLGLGLIAATIVLRDRREGAAAAGDAPQAPAGATAEAQRAPAATATTAAPNEGTPTTVPATSPPGGGTTAPTEAPAPEASSAPTRRPSGGPAPAKPKARDCDPPYVYDSNNVKRFKPQCLGDGS